LFALHHRAVVVHQFADDTHRRQPAQPAKVDGCFGMARTQEHAAVPRNQRKHVSGTGEVVGAGIRIGKRPAAGSALLRRNAGSPVGLVIDRNRKRRGVVGIVMRHHRIKPKAAGVLLGDRGADDARGMTDDERHFFGRAERGRNNQVALALAVVVIGNHDKLALGKGMQNFLDRIRHRVSRFEGSEH
jgi:hypothetical protein